MHIFASPDFYPPVSFSTINLILEPLFCLGQAGHPCLLAIGYFLSPGLHYEEQRVSNTFRIQVLPLVLVSMGVAQLTFCLEENIDHDER